MNNLTKRFARKIAVAASAVGLLATVAAGASTASATSTGDMTAAGVEQCGPGQFCLWENHSFGGRMYSYHTGVAYVDWFNDKASSVYNRTDRAMCLYADHSWRGWMPVRTQATYPHIARIYPGESMTYIGFQANDATSSFGNC